MGNPIRGKEFHKVECCYWMKSGIINRIINKISSLLYRKFNIVWKERTLNLTSGDKWMIYFAPQWHALSGKFVKYMLKTLAKHPEIMKYFQHSYVPDELLIPTILFNSKFSECALRTDFPEGTHYNAKCGIHYLNYSPVLEVFNETKYDEIIQSGKCFLRKVTSQKSLKLLELIDVSRNS